MSLFRGTLRQTLFLTNVFIMYSVSPNISMHFLSVSVDETLFGQTYNFNPPEANEVCIVATFSPIGRIIDALLKSIRN